MRKVVEDYRGYLFDQETNSTRSVSNVYLLDEWEQPYPSQKDGESPLDFAERKRVWGEAVKPIVKIRMAAYNVKSKLGIFESYPKNGKVTIIYWDNKSGDYEFVSDVKEINITPIESFEDFYNPETQKMNRIYSSTKIIDFNVEEEYYEIINGTFVRTESPKKLCREELWCKIDDWSFFATAAHLKGYTPKSNNEKYIWVGPNQKFVRDGSKMKKFSKYQ